MTAAGRVGGLGGEGTLFAPTLDNVDKRWKNSRMWPFRERKLYPTLVDVLRAVEQHRASTDQKIKQLEVEWNDMFDRFRRLYAKISKRAQEAERGEIEGPPGTEGSPGAIAPQMDAQAHYPAIPGPRRNLRGF